MFLHLPEQDNWWFLRGKNCSYSEISFRRHSERRTNEVAWPLPDKEWGRYLYSSSNVARTRLWLKKRCVCAVSNAGFVVLVSNAICDPVMPFHCILHQQALRAEHKKTMQQQTRTTATTKLLISQFLRHSIMDSSRCFCIKWPSSNMDYECVTMLRGLAEFI